MVISMVALFAILTFVSLLITATFGALAHSGRPVITYHRIFASLTILLALVEVVLVLV